MQENEYWKWTIKNTNSGETSSENGQSPQKYSLNIYSYILAIVPSRFIASACEYKKRARIG